MKRKICQYLSEVVEETSVEELWNMMENPPEGEMGIERVENVGAYCNFYWNRGSYIKICLEKLQEENLGVAQSGIGKTICMDYSSPNIAKNFHVGHLRTTVIGNSLYKIYQKLGFHVVRINHLGDWGTQFGKLIVAYKLWSNEEVVREKGIEELLRIYVKFNTEAEQIKIFHFKILCSIMLLELIQNITMKGVCYAHID